MKDSTYDKAIRVENLYTEGCIRTYTGQYVSIKHPDPDTLVIEDIAHALSMIPRFGGHLPIFYSVAEHCIKCVEYSGGQHAFEVLMHDASEAYMLDIPSPLKRCIPNYYKLEHNFMITLSKKFGFKYPFNKFIKSIDNKILELEWEELMLRKRLPDRKRIPYESAKAHVSNPTQVKKQFLNLFENLKSSNFLNSI